jgi:hypothetical protein
MNQSMKNYFMPYFSGFVALSAFIVTLFGASYCNFITFCQTNPAVEDPAILHYGIWWYRGWVAVSSNDGDYILETCFNYDDDTNIDSNWIAARTFNTLALVFGIAATCWSCVAGCVQPSKRMLQATGAFYMLVCFFTGMTLLLLQSNACKANENVAVFENTFPKLDITFQDTCSLGVGAKTTIAATVLWFVAAVASCISEPIKDEDGGDAQVSPIKEGGGDMEEVSGDQVKEDMAPVDEASDDKVKEDVAPVEEDTASPRDVVSGDV